MMAKSHKSKCWIWKRGLRNGYGILSVDSKILYAHRASFALFNGGIPKNKCILHKCDNPLCYNPEHLFAGTRTQNAEDRDLKGRTAKGAKHYKTTLTEKDVKEIRDLVKNGMEHAPVALIYKISRSAVTQIVNNKRHKYGK